MPPPANADEFLELIQRSGVADEGKLRNYIQKLKDSGAFPTDSQKFAGRLVQDGLLTYFQAEQLLQGKYKRFTIGKYKVLEKLGAGGMAQVFLCEHKMMRRRVAIKVLPTAKADDPSSLERFYREARAVAAVDHPNIVRAYDIDQDENLHFLVMEYVDGTNLQDLVKKFGQLDMLRACHYIYASAVGLQHAHEMGLIHRDIKPGNILLDRTGVVKILDMGLARFFHDEEDALTKKYDENVLGTADYLAPEQALDSHTVDIRADIYSLGATFYFLLTGSAVFPEGSVAQKLIWHQNRVPKPIKSFRADVPDEVIAIVEKMMAKKVENRYQTPADVMGALAPWVATPIPPPAEREMPQVSAAARGDARAGPVTMTTSAISTAGMTLPRPPSQQSMHLAPGLPAATVTPTHPGPSAAPAQIPNGPAPQQDAHPVVWSNIDEENTPSNAQGNTNRSSAHNSPPPRKKSGRLNVQSKAGQRPVQRAGKQRPLSAEEPRGKNKGIILGVVALLVLVLIVVGAYFAFFSGGKPPGDGEEKPAPEKGIYRVPSDETPSLSEALKKAKPGETIILAKANIKTGALSLTRNQHKDVIIEGTIHDGKPTVLEPNGNLRYLINIESSEGIRFKNIDFDGGGKVDCCVQVVGSCPGVTIEGGVVRGAKLAGVRFSNAAGSDTRPLLLDRVRFLLQAGQTGVSLEADAQRSDTRRLAIRGCRFEGSGGQVGKGIRFDAATSEVDVSNNRFFSLESALFFSKPISKTIKGQIVSNTIFDSRVGLEFDLNNLPPNAFDLSVRQNYIGKTQQGGQGNGGGGGIPGVNADSNGHGPDTNPGNIDLKMSRIENPQIPQPPDLNNDSAFLRFPGPMPEVNGKKVGAP
ncbi:MAG: protein kinase [Planctomycetes bacterium]|nr:protein kinase [Planctomycetota bacterium]